MKSLQEKIIIGLLNGKYHIEKSWKDESGEANIIAIILIIIVVIGLAVFFKDQIGQIVTDLFAKISSALSGFDGTVTPATPTPTPTP